MNKRIIIFIQKKLQRQIFVGTLINKVNYKHKLRLICKKINKYKYILAKLTEIRKYYQSYEVLELLHDCIKITLENILQNVFFSLYIFTNL